MQSGTSGLSISRGVKISLFNYYLLRVKLVAIVINMCNFLCALIRWLQIFPFSSAVVKVTKEKSFVRIWLNMKYGFIDKFSFFLYFKVAAARVICVTRIYPLSH